MKSYGTTAEVRAEQKRLGALAMTVASDPGETVARKTVRLGKIEAELDALDTELKALASLDARRSALYRGGFDAAANLNPTARLDGSHYRPAGAGLSAASRGLALSGKGVPCAPPRLTLSDDQAAELHEAATQRKSASIEVKALTDSTAAPPAAIPDFKLPPVTFAREPTRVMNLLPTAATGSAVVEFFTTTGTTGAAPVAEGAVKPSSNLSYTAVLVHMTKIAHTIEVTDEVLADFHGVVTTVQNDMSNGVILAESAELLSSLGTGASKWPGMLNTSGLLTRAKAGETYSLDVIEEAIDDLRNGAAFLAPDGIVMHPTTWGALRRTKDTQGRYLLDPNPSLEVPMSLWGIPVVTSTQMPVGTALVGAFQECTQAWVRDGIRVDSSPWGTAQFAANSTLLRCEERVALCVYRPAGLIKVTGL